MKYLSIITLVFLLLLMFSCSKSSLISFNDIDTSSELAITSKGCVFSPCLSGTELQLEDIPSIITDYVNTNFSGKKVAEVEVLGCAISEVEGESFFSGPKEDIDFYVIELKKNSTLLFDAEGNFMSEEKKEEHEKGIDIATLPSTITDYIKINYPDEILKEAELSTTFGSKFINVELANEEVIFDAASGDFLCAKD